MYEYIPWLWIYLKYLSPPSHTHTEENKIVLVTSVNFKSGGGISCAILRKCSPLTQIRRQQEKPGPLLHVYFMSLTLFFEPFWFWLRIDGDIRNRKMTRRLGDSAIECLKENFPLRWVGESSTPRLADSESWQLPNSPSRGVAMVSRGVAIQNFFNLSSIYRTLNS